MCHKHVSCICDASVLPMLPLQFLAKSAIEDWPCVVLCDYTKLGRLTAKDLSWTMKP